MKVRVIYQADGVVSIMNADWSKKKADETEADFFDRNQDKIPHLAGLPYDDIDNSELPPDRSTREKWRGQQGQGVHVDDTIVTDQDKMDALEVEIDVELAKTNPNFKKLIQAQIKLRRKQLD